HRASAAGDHVDRLLAACRHVPGVEYGGKFLLRDGSLPRRRRINEAYQNVGDDRTDDFSHPPAVSAADDPFFPRTRTGAGRGEVDGLVRGTRECPALFAPADGGILHLPMEAGA